MLGAGEACEEDCTKNVHRPSKRNRQQRRCALIAVFLLKTIFCSYAKYFFMCIATCFAAELCLPHPLAT